MHATTVEIDKFKDEDADSTNELQDIALSGTSLSISQGSTVDLSVLQDGVTDADADPNNELQTLSVNGNDLSISNGNTVTLPTGGGGPVTVWNDTKIKIVRAFWPNVDTIISLSWAKIYVNNTTNTFTIQNPSSTNVVRCAYSDHGGTPVWTNILAGTTLAVNIPTNRIFDLRLANAQLDKSLTWFGMGNGGGYYTGHMIYNE